MLAILARLVQFLIALFFVRLVLHTLASLARRGRSNGPRRPGDAELVLDRVCNTFIPRATALKARVGGREESFCSPACRDRALAQVAKAS